MRKLLLAGTSSFALALGASIAVGLPDAAHAGDAVTMPDGRVIVVNEDGTWDPVPAGSPEAAKAEPVTIVPAAGQALPYVSGVLALWAGGQTNVSDDGDFDHGPATPIFGGDARMAGEAWQLEVFGSYIGNTSTTNGTQNTDASAYFGGAIHGLMRDAGLFGGNTTLGIFLAADTVQHISSNANSVNLYPGLEAALSSGDQSYYLQVGGAFAVTGEESETWQIGAFGRGGIRHFFSPSQKLEADFLGGWGYFDSSTHDTWSLGWGLEYEQQLMGGPFSLFVSYRGTLVEEGDSSSSFMDHAVWDHAGLAGVRVRLGDLQTDYTKGASVFNFPGFYFQRFRSYPDEL